MNKITLNNQTYQLFDNPADAVKETTETGNDFMTCEPFSRKVFDITGFFRAEPGCYVVFGCDGLNRERVLEEAKRHRERLDYKGKFLGYAKARGGVAE